MSETTLISVPDFITVTTGLFVFLLGAEITRRVRILRDFNIPEPVTGGIALSLAGLALYVYGGIELDYEMETRDVLLVAFFAGIGLNARLSDLASGGRALGILVGLTVATILLQNIVGVVGSVAFGLPAEAGVLMGSASLIGGHGTAIAWGPTIEASSGMVGAAELGVAVATLGLVAASLVGGPMAKFLIERDKLTADAGAPDVIGVSYANEKTAAIDVPGMMAALLAINIAIILGYVANQAIAEAGLQLPLFVPCLICGILLGNTVPRLIPRFGEVPGSPSLALITDYALGAFLAMSLMSMKLWVLADSGLAVVVVLALQVLATVLFVLLLLYPLLGRSYDAAVLGAGFGGFALGATPTAIANMTAVTKRWGPAPVAFVVLPLVSAFFADLANATIIQTVLSIVGGS